MNDERLLEALRVAAEQIEIMRAQLLIRRDRITNLQVGPGGIMEMKQTIANLEKYRDLVEYISSDYVELNYEKAQCQRDDWHKRCINNIIKDHTK